MDTFEQMANKLRPGCEVWIRLYAPNDERIGVVTVDKWERGECLVEYRGNDTTGSEKLAAALSAASSSVVESAVEGSDPR